MRSVSGGRRMLIPHSPQNLAFLVHLHTHQRIPNTPAILGVSLFSFETNDVTRMYSLMYLFFVRVFAYSLRTEVMALTAPHSTVSFSKNKPKPIFRAIIPHASWFC